MQVILGGDIGDLGSITADEVLTTLSNPVDINDGQGFVGRPTTRLHVSPTHVLKLKTDYSMAEDRARQWCARQLERERNYGIYHPLRTWLVLASETGCALANITPRLPTLAAQLGEDATLSREARFELLCQLWDMYFDFLSQHRLRQDEGLTNYGLDDDKLWYLDDDIYQPDNLIGCAHSLAGHLRGLDFITPTLCYVLGQRLRKRVSSLGDNMVDSLARNFRDAWLPESRRSLGTAFLRGLSPNPPAGGDGLREQGRIAILADIHANQPALDAVLDDMQNQNISQVIVLGDIVGYGPDPAYCIDRIIALNPVLIRGNHDHATGGGNPGGGFNRAARWSVGWTVKQISDEARLWLGSLPLYLRQDDLYLVHGAPMDATFFNAYVYPRTAEANLEYMVQQELRLCFHGHSHIAGCWQREPGGIVTFNHPHEQHLEKRRHYLVCPGSVGQPRDRTEGASYLIYDRDHALLRWRTLEYNREGLLERMRKEGFPDYVWRLFEPVH